MEKQRILVIDNSVDLTGALKSITRSSYDLKNYFDFHFVLAKHSRGRFWVEEKGFSKIHELPFVEISKRVIPLLTYIPYLLINAIRVFNIIKHNKISIVHLNDVYNLIPVVLRLIGCKTPYVCHIRFLPNRFPKWLFNFWMFFHLRFAEKIIVVSGSVKNMIRPHEKIILIHNELPVVERYPNFNLETLTKAHNTFLYLANYIKGKGQDFALEAFASIEDKIPDWKLRFVGSDMDLAKNKLFKAKLQEKAEKLNISHKIEWCGFTEDVEKEYKSADVVLNFSESESFSITCLEALFFGRALIATDCGGPAEIVDNYESGILVPNKDISGMASAMLQLALDNSLRNRLAHEGKNRSRKKFSFEKTSLRLRGIYYEILNRNDLTA